MNNDRTPPHLRSNEIEAANRAEATALLIRAGYRVYRPEADVNGEDLVLRDPTGQLRSVQLKGRPYVDWRRYGGTGTWMLFPDPAFTPHRDWFLIEHDRLFTELESWHGHTPGWKAHQIWGYPSLSKRLRAFLDPYSRAHWRAGTSADCTARSASVVHVTIAALDTAGVVFTNGDAPDFKLRKVVM